MNNCKTSNSGSSGRLFVVSAPSGAGKTTIIAKAAQELTTLAVTISATTRRPRPGERDGVDYYFISPREFEQKIGEGAFVEWAEVHGNRYGTLKTEVERRLAQGCTLLFELDVQGMRSLKRIYPETVSIFIVPPSIEELERRLTVRGANEADDMAMRLRKAREEMRARDEFDYVVVNDDVERAAEEFIGIIKNAIRTQVVV